MTQVDTSAERRIVRGYPEQPAPDRTAEDILSGIGSAVLNTPTANFWRWGQMQDYRLTPDRSYLLDEKELSRLGDGIDKAFWPAFADAVSRPHAEAIRSEILLRQSREQSIANAGFAGAAASAVSSVLDPATLAASFATGGLGEVAAASNIATKIPALVRAGLVASVPNTALAAAEYAIDPTGSKGEIVSQGISGAVQGMFGSVAVGSSRLVRGLREATGAVAGMPVAEPFAYMADANRTHGLEMSQLALQGIIGGIGGALHSPGSEVENGRRDIIRAATQYAKDVEDEFIRKSGLAKTTDGETYYADSESQTRYDRNAAPVVDEHKNALAATNRLLLEDQRAGESDKKGSPVPPSDGPDTPVTPPGIIDGGEGGGGGGGGPSNLGKQPWEMMEDEFRTTVATATADASADHLAWIEYALDNGYIVPKEVLESRPELKARGPGGGGGPPGTGTGVGGGTGLPVPKGGQGSSGGSGGSGGGKQPPKQPPKGPYDADFSRVTDAPPAMNVKVGKLSLSRPFEAITELLMNRRNKDPNKPFVSAISRLGNMLFPDRLAKDGGPSVTSAPQWKRSRVRAAIAAFDTEMEDAYAQHVKYARQNGREELTWSQFEDEAGIVTRDLSQLPSDPGLRRAIELQEQAYSALLEQAKAHDGLLSGINYESGWVPRIDDQVKYDQAIRKFGMDNVERVLQIGIKAARPYLTDAQALNLAKAKIRMAQDLTAASSYAKARWLQQDQVGALRNALGQLGLKNDEIENIVGALRAKSDSLGKIFNPRIDIDEGASITVNGETLHVYDLFENNARTLFHRYANDAYGHMAMREIHRVFSTPDKHINSNEELLQHMEQNARTAGAKSENIRHDLEVFRYGLNNLVGIPNRPDDAKAEGFVRLLKSINFLRTLSGSQTGLNNLGEASEAVFSSAFGVGVRGIPSFGEIIQVLQGKNPDRQLIREIMSLGLGVERAASRPVERVGEDFTSIRSTSLEHNLARARRVAADVSLQSYGQDAMSLATGVRVAQQWMDAALSGDVPSARRLADLGVSKAELDRVNAQLKKHAKLDSDGMLWASNLHKWDDVGAVAIFRDAVTSHAEKLIFSSAPEERARWMTHWFGQLATELRTFMLGGWSAKTLRAAQLRDVQAAGSIVGSAVISGLISAGNAYLYSVGRTDQDEFLRERLKTENLVKAAFSRSGYSSILPAVWDTGTGFTGREPTFSQYRTSGIMGGLFRTPTADLFDKSAKSIRGLVAPITNDEYDFSQQDAKALRDTLVPRVIFLHPLFDRMMRDLPETSRGN